MTVRINLAPSDGMSAEEQKALAAAAGDVRRRMGGLGLVDKPEQAGAGVPVGPVTLAPSEPLLAGEAEALAEQVRRVQGDLAVGDSYPAVRGSAVLGR